jgi:hypothetical protein
MKHIDPPDRITHSPAAVEVWDAVVPKAQASELFDFSEMPEVYCLQYEMFSYAAGAALEAARAGADHISLPMLRKWARDQLLIEDETMRELFGDKW